MNKVNSFSIKFLTRGLLVVLWHQKLSLICSEFEF
nr:MAG TPA: hypothetical protein [Caudoviricetes sp.]DAS83180.1 MAG TPA: hypothetical protein [Caudoviricetes sp.]DAX53941.1 MAG TPA: hypothetical protein [Caudoviricetes sp.]